MTTTTKIQRWGNSLALRIPEALAAEVNLKEGAVVAVFVEGGRIIVAPIGKMKVTLKGLLSGVTARNTHRAISTGKRVGKEIW